MDGFETYNFNGKCDNARETLVQSNLVKSYGRGRHEVYTTYADLRLIKIFFENSYFFTFNLLKQPKPRTYLPSKEFLFTLGIFNC